MKTTPVDTGQVALREAHLRDYWKVVWQGRWTLTAVFLVIVGATAAWTFLQTPIYEATATVEVQPKARQLLASQDVSGLGAAGYGWYAEEKYHATQVEILMSRDVASRVVKALDLKNDPEFADYSDPIEAFRNRIHVVPRRDTGLIEVSIAGPDPKQITRWVNAVAQAYVGRNLEKAQENVKSAIGAISAQMEKLQNELNQAETQRFDALQQTQVFHSEEQIEIAREKLKTYNVELTETQIELSRLRDALARIPASKGREEELLSLPVLAEDQALRDLLTTKVTLERQLASAKVDLRPDHPVYEKTVSELGKVQQRIENQIGVSLNSLKTRHDLLVEHEQYLRDEIREAEDVSVEVARAGSDYEVYKTRAETKRRIFELIGKTMSEVQFSAELLNNNISLLDEATTPLYPVRPRRRMNLLIGAMLGLFLGVAAAFFLDYLDNTFRTPEDIEKYLGLAVLGVIPKIQRQEGLANRTVKEAFQSLRTSVIFSSKNRQRKAILVTSTGPQEGKSSTVANLARMLAATGDRVVIVDCDLRRPTQHLIHEVEREGGLSNYLAEPLDRTDWTSYPKPASPSNLHVITCGPIPPSPPELLGSERFRGLLAALGESYDWLVLDSPPAATLADASVLAAVVDMIVLVVKHNQTDRDLVSKTLQRLRSLNPNVAGAVLNNVDLDRAYGKDYYYAGYYYYEEGGDKRVKKRREPAKAAKAG